MFKSAIFLAVICVIALITHFILRYKFDIEKEYIYESVNKIDRFGSILIVTVSLIIYIWYAVVQFKTYNSAALIFVPYFLLIYSLVLGIFRTYMQWKYKKHTKRYILWISSDVYGLIALLGMVFVFPPT